MLMFFSTLLKVSGIYLNVCLISLFSGSIISVIFVSVSNGRFSPHWVIVSCFLYLLVFNWMPDVFLVTVFCCLPFNNVKICSGLQVGFSNLLDALGLDLSIVKMGFDKLVK